MAQTTSQAQPQAEERYQSFAAFFPFYLSEHSNATNRRLHFVGTSLVNLLLLTAVISGTWWLLFLLPVAGYGFAWYGHFIVEKNRPATFKYPLWSLMGDYKMYFMMLTGKLW
jgi:hypothetical protein